MEKEIWKDIPGFEGIYKISNFGNVHSIRYNKLIKISIGKRGYRVISLWYRGKGKTVAIHRLLALLFIPNELNLPCVNHKDGNKLNNDLNNLEWVTYSQNNQHAFDMKLKIANNPFGTKSKRGLFNLDELKQIKIMKEEGYTNKHIAEYFDVEKSTIQKITSGKHYKGEY